MMSQAAYPLSQVFSVAEVAAALRVSPETIRRKIANGELPAIEVGGATRKQHRILSSDLAAWLGETRARQLFGIGEALEELRGVLSELDAKSLEALLNEAKTWARAQRPEPVGETLPTPTPAEIKKRFNR